MNSDKYFDIEGIAKLARINLDVKEGQKLRSDLTQIVNYVKQLGELKLDGIEPTAHATEVNNIFREDIAEESFSRGKMLSNAPELVDDNLVAVPKVISDDEEAF
jgi:aspartyl-tRNA(Asn)/glutamyl-tRNA(Gln) amidotransferase subunit C